LLKAKPSRLQADARKLKKAIAKRIATKG